MNYSRIILISLLFAGRLCMGQIFDQNQDTVSYKMDGTPLQWIVYGEKAYSYFDREVFGGYADHRFMIFDLVSGESVNVPTPPDLNKAYKDLFVKNNRVYTVDYYSGNTFLLDETEAKWIKVKQCDDLVYEDEDYYVSSIDFGEWGGHTWFVDKNTGEEFVIHVSHPVINRANSAYYLSSSRAIIKIPDPRLMQKCTASNRYKPVKKMDYYPYDEEYNSDGFETLFIDTSNRLVSKFSISTSFLQKGELYHICTNDSISYCARLKNGTLEPTYYFDKGMRPSRWRSHFRNRIIGGAQSLQFKTMDENLDAILSINSKVAKVLFFKNTFREHLKTKAQADSIFRYKWNFFIQKMPHLADYECDSIEMQNYGRNITPRFSSFRSYNPYQNQVPLGDVYTYRTLIDSSLVIYTHYNNELEGNKVAVISMSWELNNQNRPLYHRGNSKSKELKNDMLKEQHDQLIKFVSSVFGKPTLYQAKDKYDSLNWQSKDGLSIELWPTNISTYREVHLVLYVTK